MRPSIRKSARTHEQAYKAVSSSPVSVGYNGHGELLIARTDSQSGALISSTVDSRDHEFILCVMMNEAEAEPLAEILQATERKGVAPAEIDAFEADWIKAHTHYIL